jgi:hypothetical protein
MAPSAEDAPGVCPPVCQTGPVDYQAAANANSVSNKKTGRNREDSGPSCDPGSLSKPPLRDFPEAIDLAHPAGQWVPSGENLGHHPQFVDSKQLNSGTHTVNRTTLQLYVPVVGIRTHGFAVSWRPITSNSNPAALRTCQTGATPRKLAVASCAVSRRRARDFHSSRSRPPSGRRARRSERVSLARVLDRRALLVRQASAPERGQEGRALDKKDRGPQRSASAIISSSSPRPHGGPALSRHSPLERSLESCPLLANATAATTIHIAPANADV